MSSVLVHPQTGLLPLVAVCLLAASSFPYPTILHPELKRERLSSLNSRSAAVFTVAMTGITVPSSAEHCGQGMRGSDDRGYAITHYMEEEPFSIFLSGLSGQKEDSGCWKGQRQHVSTAARWDCPVGIAKPCFLCPYHQVLKCEAIIFFFFFFNLLFY